MTEELEVATAQENTPVFLPVNPDTGDARATTEAMKIAAGSDLEFDGRKREHNRHQSFRDHVNIGVLIIIWLIIVSICLGIVVFLWHLLTPERLHFLGDPALEKLQTILSATVLSSALTGYANRRMN